MRLRIRSALGARTRLAVTIVLPALCVPAVLCSGLSAAQAASARCTPSRLSARLGVRGVDGGTASRIVVLTNISRATCTLKGYPTLRMLGGTGDPLPTQLRHGRSPAFPALPRRLLTLHPGERASFEAEWANGRGSGGVSCPTASAVQITPPGDRAPITISWQLQPYGSHTSQTAGCGEIHLSPVYPGTGFASQAPEIEHRGPAANRYRAWLDAKRLLGQITLPAHAVRLHSEPAGDGGALAHHGLLIASPVLLDLHAWWRAPEGAKAVLAFLAAHPPHATTYSGSGKSFGNHPHYRYLTFSMPPIREELQSRSLLITVERLSDGQTGIRADAEVRWTIPRAPSEQIPPGVHEIDITRSHRRGTPALSIHLRAAAQVHKVLGVIASLPITQPGLIECAAFRLAPKITLTFRRRAQGPVLALARLPIETQDTCGEGVGLTIRGRAQTPLDGAGRALQRIGRLLGVKLGR